MAIKAFQSSFNPTMNYIWTRPLIESQPDAPYKALWVTNLPPDTTEDDVRALFSIMGPLTAVCVESHPNMQVLAYICYNNPENGRNALCLLNDYFMHGRRVHISTYIDDAPNRRHLGGRSTVFIDGLPWRISTTGLFDIVKSYGVVVSMRIMRRNSQCKTKQARVEFLEERDAETAVRHLHAATLQGQTILARPWADRRNSSRSSSPGSTDVERHPMHVYVAPIERFATREDILRLFESFGNNRKFIKRIEWPKNKKPGYNAHVFVEFYDAESAGHAMCSMHQMRWNGRKLNVSPRKSAIEHLLTHPPVPAGGVDFSSAANDSVYNGHPSMPAELLNYPAPAPYMANYIPEPQNSTLPGNYQQHLPIFSDSPQCHDQAFAPLLHPHYPGVSPLFALSQQGFTPPHPSFLPPHGISAPPPTPTQGSPSTSHMPVGPQYAMSAPGGMAALNVHVASLALRDLHVYAGAPPVGTSAGSAAKPWLGSPPPYPEAA